MTRNTQVKVINETVLGKSIIKSGWHNFTSHPWRRFFARNFELLN